MFGLFNPTLLLQNLVLWLTCAGGSQLNALQQIARLEAAVGCAGSGGMPNRLTQLEKEVLGSEPNNPAERLGTIPERIARLELTMAI